jgi:hypothetical protein
MRISNKTLNLCFCPALHGQVYEFALSIEVGIDKRKFRKNCAFAKSF